MTQNTWRCISLDKTLTSCCELTYRFEKFNSVNFDKLNCGILEFSNLPLKKY